MRTALMLLLLFLPWPVRRWGLRKFFGYQISESARIGFSWICPRMLVLEKGAQIGHLTFCKSLSLVSMREYSFVGNLNWITGYPLEDKSHFQHDVDRSPQLLLGEHAAITNRHLIDCTNRISIGKFSTIAGFRSQLLSHSIDLIESRQMSKSIDIGEFCFVGTDCVVLGGSKLPNYSVLGAKSLLNREHYNEYRLYAGAPAKEIKVLSSDWKYFARQRGFVD